MKFPDLLSMLRAAVAEFGGDAKVREIRTIAFDRDTSDPNADPSGYSRTEPGVIGSAKTALLIRVDAHGPNMSLVEKDGTPDVHRREQMKMYAKRKKDWAALSAQQEKRRNDSTSG